MEALLAKYAFLAQFDIVIAFDTEYVAGENLSGVPNNENAVLTYQITLYHPRTGKTFSGIYMVKGRERRHRLSLLALIAYTISGARKKGLDIHGDYLADIAREQADHPRRKPKPRKLRIALVAHYSRADLSTFSDFKNLKKSFDGVGGTYCTITRPALRDIKMPNGSTVKASLTLYDTRLLAPAGAGRLKDLGDLIGLKKLSVPDVVDEKGEMAPGITRMDLVKKRHQAEFEAYALRDPLVSLEYLKLIDKFAGEWGLPKLPATVASMAVQRLCKDAIQHLPAILGKELTARGRLGKSIPEAAAFRTLPPMLFTAAETRLSSMASSPRRRSGRSSIGICAAATPASWPCSEPWTGPASSTHPMDLDQLATVDALTVATVDFRFPPGTRFPCLPVRNGDGGLAFPNFGSTTAVGAELVVALSLGADMIVRAGFRVPWLEPDMAKAPLPLRDFAQLINRNRAYGKGTVFEKLVKEIGNSLYGKLAQGVSGMKSIPDRATLFDTRSGGRHILPPSVLTSPLLAAQTSGWPRAVVSEIMSRLSSSVTVLSVTTDGLFCDATPEEMDYATAGPICCHFAKLRALVDPDGSDQILDVKHRALQVLVARTRHCVTVEPYAGSLPALARAGHRLNDDAGDFDYDKSNKAAEKDALTCECAAFLELQRNRTYDTKLSVSSFITMSKQWEADADLIVEYTQKRVALDYDWKRKPINPIDVDGMIQFETEPWDSVEEYLSFRNDFDAWRENAHGVLKTVADLEAFLLWRPTHRRRTFAQRTPFENAVVAAWAKGIACFSIRNDKGGKREPGDTSLSKALVAKLLTAMGVRGVTVPVLKKAAWREDDPTGTVSILHPRDELLFERLLEHTTREGLETLLKPDVSRLTSETVKIPQRTSSSFQPDHSVFFGANAVQPLEPADELEISRNQKIQPGRLRRGESVMDRLDSPSKTAQNSAAARPSIAPDLDIPPQPSAEPARDAPPPSESPPPAAPAAAPAPSKMALDDYQHGVRIKHEMKRRHGVGDVILRLAVKQAAKIPDLSDRQRVLRGYVFALMLKTKKTEGTCRSLLQAIIEATG